MTEEIKFEEIEFSKIDYTDPIFNSIKEEYPDFPAWYEKALLTSDDRSAFVACGLSSYAGIIVFKHNDMPDGDPRNGLKITTLKIAQADQARGLADTLLAKAFERAIEFKLDLIFITVFEKHLDIIRYLELRGFRRATARTIRGELIYVAEISNPEFLYRDLNRLAYDILADEYLERSENPGKTQETSSYLAKLLANSLESPINRVLELGPGAGDVLAELSKICNESVAVEISPKMAEIAKKNAPNALVINSDILTIDFPKNTFDGIYAGAFIHLFPRKIAKRLLKKITAWLVPDGKLFINTTVSSNDSESIELKSDYIKRVARYRARWSEEQFNKLVMSSGLKIIKRYTTDERERKKFWVAYICAKTPQYENNKHIGDGFL